MNINETLVEISEKDGLISYNYFACTCKEEDKLYWELALKEYYEGEVPCLPMSGLIMELDWEHNAWIENIAADMWFGISIRDANNRMYIQCDFIEYGILAAIMILREVNSKKEIE